ncbi:MAG: alpha/beta fold hydrolase [Deltaproteobacteria bacterium]
MPRERVVILHGQELHFYEKGKGSTVILLHGMVGASTDWAYVFGPLSTKYRVIALDQIGFGRSARPKIEYRISTFVEYLRDFMRSQHISRAAIVGNSLGGWIAMDFAAQHPELVSCLVLVDPAGLDTPVHHAVPVNMNPSSREDVRNLWRTLFYDNKLATDYLVDYEWRRLQRFSDRETIRSVTSALVSGTEYEDQKIGSIQAPTLLIWGRNDALLPLSYGELVHKAIGGSTLTVLDECGHVPQLEKPREFVQALLKFLDRH